MQIRLLRGDQLTPHIDDLARLRISVFREFPYLYDGNRAYEAEYLAGYARSAASLCVLAVDDGQVVGASTALPLADETLAFRQPFEQAGLETGSIFYLAESVLLPAYRGQGLGVRFFAEREAHARRLGFACCAFCAVQRPLDHPLRPVDYQPLDAFWLRRGYQPRPDLHTHFHWRDLGADEESAKPMSFWLKAIAP